jgi:hypothetical protein
MPRSDQELDEGFNILQNSIRNLAENMQRNAEREMVSFQHKNSNLNAVAQLMQATGLFGENMAIDPEAVSKATGGLITPKDKTKSIRREEMSAKVTEGEAKRAAALALQDIKFGQNLTLEQVKNANELNRIAEMAKNGESAAAFKALMDHVNTFGTTGGVEDVAASQRVIAQAKNKPLSQEQKPLQEQVGEPTGGIFGFGQKTVTRSELISLLESEQKANEAEQNWKDIQELIKTGTQPKSGGTWEEKFFQEYPVLKGKIGFAKE